MIGINKITQKEDGTMKVLVAYDGTLQSKEALRYGLEKVRENGGEVFALHVFNEGLFIDYDVGGAVEVAKREAARYLAEAKDLVREFGNDVRATVFNREGDPGEETIRFAAERNVDVLLCPPKYKSIIRQFKEIVGGRGRQAMENTILDGAEKLKMAVVSVH